MAVTYQEVNYVIGPWGAKVLQDVDRILGDNDGWVEDSDFQMSGGSGYTEEKAHVVKECLGYCNALRTAGIYNPELTARIDRASKIPADTLPDPEEFHDIAIASIAASTGNKPEQVLAALADYLDPPLQKLLLPLTIRWISTLPCLSA